MIEVRDLKKSYKKHGREVGLLGVSFTVPKGQIVGVLGENGAGKTTLLRTMTGLLPKQSGTVLYDGEPPERQYRRISYLTGEGSYYPCLTVGEYGAFLTDLHPAFDPARYAEFLRFFSLRPDDKISELSTGQKARVELAAGFAKRADYYLMDEPFLGKDAFTRKDFIKLMSGTLHGEETILLSTHYLDDVEHFLDRALIFHEGKLVDDCMMDALHDSGGTLLTHMAACCGWNPDHYLTFREEQL